MASSASTPPPRLDPELRTPISLRASEPPRHLRLVAVRPPRKGSGVARSLLVVGLSLVAVTLFAVSLAEPWWCFKLYAPQYPHGLTLVISLTGLSGDVHEIDTLNHYIGMGHLAGAARCEREYATWAVGLLGLTVLAMTLFAGRKLGRSIGLAGALFPLGFIADSGYWLYRFGHQLDRRAPLRIPTFTPQMFGNGSIGQFTTFALPERGFWLAVAGAVLLLGMLVLRERACAQANDASTFVALWRRAFRRASLQDKVG